MHSAPNPLARTIPRAHWDHKGKRKWDANMCLEGETNGNVSRVALITNTCTRGRTVVQTKKREKILYVCVCLCVHAYGHSYTHAHIIDWKPFFWFESSLRQEELNSLTVIRVSFTEQNTEQITMLCCNRGSNDPWLNFSVSLYSQLQPTTNKLLFF